MTGGGPTNADDGPRTARDVDAGISSPFDRKIRSKMSWIIDWKMCTISG